MVESIESKYVIGHYIPFAIENAMSINTRRSFFTKIFVKSIFIFL